MVTTAAAAAKLSPYVIMAFCTLFAPPDQTKFRADPVGQLGAGDATVFVKDSDGNYEMWDEMEVRADDGGLKFQMTKLGTFARDKNDPYIVEMRNSVGNVFKRYDFRDAGKTLKPLHKKHFQGFKAAGYEASIKVSGGVVYVHFNDYDKTFAVHADGTPLVLPTPKAVTETPAAKASTEKTQAKPAQAPAAPALEAPAPPAKNDAKSKTDDKK